MLVYKLSKKKNKIQIVPPKSHTLKIDLLIFLFKCNNYGRSKKKQKAWIYPKDVKNF